ncbi:peptide chain release factor N(5)-glutamine methyltransferase [Methylotenera sp.]|uniref:peptide chain release factor N(5)-glutamine methyltransferase n=1 Tax=Methylotenera sp. TaxID=2051956 RepID=UPI00248A65E1|nr:peptide chain release factor N(5)-glutamine methyltransferase [Methylotenera sp.]MDI1298818.1 peptide chain release factor N(5)-glutamine methyltransferase [Methylotenera sp.]
MINPQTVKNTLTSAAALLNNDEATLEAQLLLQHVLNVNRAWLIAHSDDALQANTLATFEALLKRRLSGEPIAYILGVREFYGLDLMVTPDTLIPRPDTETLVEAALDKINSPSFPRKRESIGISEGQILKVDSRFRGHDGAENSDADLSGLSVLDLGTGTGAIALAIAKNRPQAFVTAVDASEAALEVAKKNAQNLNIPNVQFILSNWFDAFSTEKFDLIVSNPPYIEQDDAHLNQGDLRFEPMSALASGVDGLDDIRQIVSNCLVYLKPQGWLMLEHGYNQALQVADLMADAGLTNIETIKDLGNNDRVTIGKNPLIVSTHWD